MTKLKTISHFKESLHLKKDFSFNIFYAYRPATATTAFNELSARPTLHRLEKDPALISDNKPGLFDRIAA